MIGELLMTLMKRVVRAFGFLLFTVVFVTLLFGSFWQSQAIKIKGHIPKQYIETYKAAGKRVQHRLAATSSSTSG